MCSEVLTLDAYPPSRGAFTGRFLPLASLHSDLAHKNCQPRTRGTNSPRSFYDEEDQPRYHKAQYRSVPLGTLLSGTPVLKALDSILWEQDTRGYTDSCFRTPSSLLRGGQFCHSRKPICIWLLSQSRRTFARTAPPISARGGEELYDFYRHSLEFNAYTANQWLLRLRAYPPPLRGGGNFTNFTNYCRTSMHTLLTSGG